MCLTHGVFRFVEAISDKCAEEGETTSSGGFEVLLAILY